MAYSGNTLIWTRGRLLNSFNNINLLYNAKGIRYQKGYASGDNIVTHKYTLEETNILGEEKTSKNITTGVTTNLYKLKYVYSDQAIIGFIHISGNTSTSYIYQRNAINDIIGIYSNSGNIVARYIYDAYGNHTVCNPDGSLNTSSSFIGNINPIRYKGYYYDQETGLYYLNARYYNPEWGRFTSPDSIDYIDPKSINGLNLYAYCGNNPIMNYDPSGHFAISTFLIGLAITSLITWGAGEIFGHQLIGGIGSIINGDAAITTGISLLAFGPVGWVIGGIAIVAGAASLAFGIAEIQESFGGGNWIKQGLGITGDLYTGLYIGANILASVATIGGNLYKNNMTTIGTSSSTDTGTKYTRYIQNAQDGSPMRVVQYNKYGKQAWRIDYIGRSHAGIPTPHKIIYAYNRLGQPLKNLQRIVPWVKWLHGWYL